MYNIYAYTYLSSFIAISYSIYRTFKHNLRNHTFLIINFYRYHLKHANFFVFKQIIIIIIIKHLKVKI